MPTPFDEKGKIDAGSIPPLVDLAIKSGCQGIVCLGVTGEANRLTDNERRTVAETVIREAKSRLPVTIGTSATGTEIAVQRSLEAADSGASAVMISPVPVAKQNLEAIFTFYQTVASAINVPIVAQDYPRESNVFMSAPFIARMFREIDKVKYLKLEDPPTPPKVTAINNLTGGGLGIFGGLGGTFLYEELKRGACGTMTGFAYPEVLVNIYSLMIKGDTEKAGQIFYRYLPIIRYEFQEGIGVSIRKEVLKRRGLIRYANVRQPNPQIDEVTRKELYQLLDTLELK
jgi:4-hydroxy-tetrahydrodipicolinate synthase